MDGRISSSTLRLLQQKNYNSENEKNEQIVALNTEQKKLERQLIITAKKLSKYDDKSEDEELNIAFMTLDKESLKMQEATLKTLDKKIKFSERLQFSLEQDYAKLLKLEDHLKRTPGEEILSLTLQKQESTIQQLRGVLEMVQRKI